MAVERAPVEAELPAVVLDPDHPPDAVQEVALVAEDQVIVDALPLVTAVGEAVRVKVGAGVHAPLLHDWEVLPEQAEPPLAGYGLEQVRD